MEIKTQKKLDYLAETKEAIKAALIEQGQEVSDADTFRSYADKVLAISGIPADVHYVTFMSEDGLTELYKRPVADGDNCADPVDRGYIDAPTKDSTPQYDYTHIGWASTPGGGWDETILNAITEDKTVYAAFAAAVRYYTITFYDDDGTTVLNTQTVAYGATPSYTPTKDGYDFAGWTPTLAAVTGDASYIATWKVKAAFGTATWAEISAITSQGSYDITAGSFKVGETRSDVLTYSDGTTEDIEFVIAHILSDGTLCLALNHALKTLKPMHSSITKSAANYFNNDLGTYLTGTIVPAFSDELAAVSKTRSVAYVNRQILLLTKENLCVVDGSKNEEYVNQMNFALFSTAANRIRKSNGTPVTYWTGTYAKVGSYYYYDHVSTSGVYTDSASLSGADGVTVNRGVVFMIFV